MSRIALIHWNADEGRERAERLRRAGFRVGFEPTTPASLKRLAEKPPDALGALPAGATLVRGPRVPVDLVVWFTTSRQALAGNFGRIARLAGAGGLWIAWPKKASGVPTDLTEDVLREVILPTGLVDVKVCAIDQTWSGLKFVRRRG